MTSLLLVTALKRKVYWVLFCLLTYFFMFLTMGSLKAQNTLVADNNYNAPTGPNMFTTVQAAVNAAADGDIVQVQPSPNAYGNVVIDKQITLMGIGFNVNKDIPITSEVGDITLTNNSDDTSDADGTVIKGLKFGILYTGANTGPAFLLQNVLVFNCQFNRVYTTNSGYSPIDGLELRDCYITSSFAGYGIYFYKPSSNITIRNNLVLYDIAFFTTSVTGIDIRNNILYGGIEIDALLTNSQIRNNLFIGATGSESAFTSQLRDCTIENNIFYGSTPSISVLGSTSANFQGNIFSNNLVYSTGDDTMPPTGGGSGNTDGGGNLTGSPNFANSQLLDTWSASYDFTLQAGSPALNAGSDGTDIGISGGLDPWTDANFILNTTKVPVIQIFNTSTVINPGADLPTRIKAISN